VQLRKELRGDPPQTTIVRWVDNWPES